MEKLAIFCTYHRPAKVFASDCVIPIQAGAAESGIDLGFLRDDIGENISHLNGGFSELTAQYWVWKNYLPAHPELEYVGFCHYRRFLDFWHVPAQLQRDSFRWVVPECFESEILPLYTEKDVLAAIPKGADIILPKPLCTHSRRKTMLALMHLVFRGYGLAEACDIVQKQSPEMAPVFAEFLKSNREYHALTYLMRRPAFEAYAGWLFPVLEELHRRLAARSDYNPKGRLEGYVAEALENVFFNHAKKANRFSICECGGVKIIDKPERQTFFAKIMEEGAWIKNCFLSRRFAAARSICTPPPPPSKKFQIAIAHRVCPALAKTATHFTDKLAMVEASAKSIAAALEGVNAKITVILDGCDDRYAAVFDSLFAHFGEKYRLLRTPAIGNRPTYAKLMEVLAADSHEADFVYFSEDDYIYRPDAFRAMMDFLGGADVDFVSPLDHPDRYNPRLPERRRNEIRVSRFCHWREAASTCCTFMTKSETFAETAKKLGAYSAGSGDGPMWLNLTKNSIFSPYATFYQALRYLLGRRATPEGLEFMVLAAWRFFRWRLPFGRRYKLWSPMPTLAVHLCKPSLPPLSEAIVK